MLTPDDLVRHSGFVRTLAGALVRDPALADDVAQDAMLVAMERPPAATENPRGWLRRVVASVVSNRARAEERRRRRERAVARAEAMPPDDAAARLETERRLVESVLALDEPYRSTVVLRFLDGLPVGEVARRQGVPAKTVETRLRRALGQLRARLDREHGAWRVALLPLLGIEPRAAARAAGVLTMASKAAFAVAGFVCGIGATALYSELATPAKPERPAPRGQEAARATPIEPAVPAAPEVAAAPRERPEASPADYLRRINEAPDLTAALRVAREIAALDPAGGRGIMLAIYRDILDAERRRTVLKAFMPAHAFVLDVLDLGATDADPAVRGTAFELLRPFALRAFQEEPDAYRGWRALHAGQPLAEVVAASARSFVERVAPLRGAALERELRLVDGPPRGLGPPLAAALREARFPEVIERWIANPMPDSEADPEGYSLEQGIRRAAWQWLGAAQPDEAYVRRVVLPILSDPHPGPEDITFAVRVVGGTRSSWSFDAILDYLRRMDISTLQTFSVGQTLGESGEKRAIPWLIGAISADNTYSTVYGLGYFGLRPLTGVSYDESHDGGWWLRWWDENKDGLPADVRALDPRALAREFRR